MAAVLKLSRPPRLKTIVASGPENYIYDVVMFVDTTGRNLLTQENLQSHRALN